MQSVHQFTASVMRRHIFLIPLLVMFLSEICKHFSDRLLSGGWNRHLFEHGGLPSSHSALVTSLLILVGKKKGTDSIEFAIATVFSCIIWYDALTWRNTVGAQAEVLNLLQEVIFLQETVGHSVVEVIAGIIFGTIITFLGIWLYREADVKMHSH